MQNRALFCMLVKVRQRDPNWIEYVVFDVQICFSKNNLMLLNIFALDVNVALDVISING